MTKYEQIDSMRQHYPVQELCEVLEVSRIRVLCLEKS